MSYGATSGYAQGLGYGGGAKLQSISSKQNLGLKTAMYQYKNIGVTQASFDETDDAGIYHYKNVEVKPGGSSSNNTPTLN